MIVSTFARSSCNSGGFAVRGSSFRSITLAFFSLAIGLPTVAGAQAPTFITQWGSRYASPQWTRPMGVAVSASGNVYLAYFEDNPWTTSGAASTLIYEFTGSGRRLGQWGSFDGTPPGGRPPGVSVGSNGDV